MLKALRDRLARVVVPPAALWPVSVAGIIAAAWSAGMSLLAFAAVSMLAWILAPLGTGAFGDVMRAAAGIWQTAHLGAVDWQGAHLSLAPLLLTVVLLLFQRRAGAWLVRGVNAPSLAAARPALGIAVAAYASLVTLVANATANTTLSMPLLRNAATAALVAAVGFTWGMLRELRVRIATPFPQALRAVGRVLQVWAGATLVLVIGSLVVHRTAFTAVTKLVAGDSTSRVELLLALFAYLPTALIWTLAFILGPGFALGTGTHVGIDGVTLGALPPVPLFALVPAHVPSYAVALLAVPFAAVVWAMWGLPRDAAGRLAWRDTLAFCAAVTVAAGGLALLGAGGIGGGRLALVGAVWWQVALAAAAQVLVAAAGIEGVRVLRAKLRP